MAEQHEQQGSPRSACLNCKKLERRVRALEDERDRLLRAVQRESEQWDRRAPNTGR